MTKPSDTKVVAPEGELILPPGVDTPQAAPQQQQLDAMADKFGSMSSDQLMLQAMGIIMQKIGAIEALLARRLPVAAVLKRDARLQEQSLAERERELAQLLDDLAEEKARDSERTEAPSE